MKTVDISNSPSHPFWMEHWAKVSCVLLFIVQGQKKEIG